MNAYKKRIWSKFIKAIKDYNMIEDGDKIAIGISGGKDSLMLLNLFIELSKDKSKKFQFIPISLNPGFKDDDINNLEKYLKSLNLDYKIYDTNIWNIVFEERDEKNPCSLCAKMRRGILYKKAEELGCNKLALGHHYDDIIETALINMFYSGNFKTMVPKIKSETGNFTLIRPMAYIEEESIESYIKNNNIPIMKYECKITERKPDYKRLEIKNLLKELEVNNKLIKKSIFNSLHNVNLNYIMGYKK
ncbi:MAG: tRNA 2-thiocytidine biosynthesis protein TtcA [Fusobacteria bacterium]|nr:tRNA 2-thiocytidine biosynthesis protein TtcA [Fusobacteriota bacterium]